MPRSWLMPAFAVHRSAFPVRRARQSRGGVIERLRFWASTSCHVFAVTPDNRYCWRLLAARPSALTSGMNRAHPHERNQLPGAAKMKWSRPHGNGRRPGCNGASGPVIHDVREQIALCHAETPLRPGTSAPTPNRSFGPSPGFRFRSATACPAIVASMSSLGAKAGARGIIPERRGGSIT